MLPAFVIGLREGLETVVVVGAIAVLLRAQGRSDLLGRMWRATALAAVVCLLVAIGLRAVEVSLPWRHQEQLETIVGLAAVVTVTYMIVWMRRFPKDLLRDTEATAGGALAHGAGKALIAMAFFAVLREGFEISIFIVATLGVSGSNAVLASVGAALGIVVAVTAGFGIITGSRRVDVGRFFRVTALILVVCASGIAMSAAHSATAAGWLNFGQSPQFNLGWLSPPGSVLSSVTTGMFGIQPYPVIIEVIVWLAYFTLMTGVVLWPSQRPRPVP